MPNPLLLAPGALPPFAHIEPRHGEPAIDTVLEANRKAIATAVAAGGPYTWERSLAPLEVLQERLNRTWAPMRHLHAVADSEELRAVYNACLPKLSDYATELGQHEGLYAAYRGVHAGPAFATLGSAERRIIENALRDFRLSGIELDARGRERFKEIKARLVQLEARFEEQLLDATHAWKKRVTDPERLAGLPDSARRLARQNAERDGVEGFHFTLELPSYMPVMTYADDRQLRAELYHAYVTRASDEGPLAGRWDNTEVMAEILSLREALAQLLGYPHYAAYSLVPKMAKDADEVVRFLMDLAGRARPVAEREIAELKAYASGQHGVTTLESWDLAYYSEKLRQHRYALSQEELRPYFPVPRVLAGLFAIVHRLYGLNIRAREGVEVWRPEVQFFELRDAAGNLRGMFYVDLYARPHKRGGAWMDECAVRNRSPAGVEPPVAFLTCNFTPPIGDQPALLTHEEVTTLFHEFGHGLHHMLTLVDYPSVAGINGVPWDAVELPSQFMENWCWEREALALVSGHYQSGAPIEEALYRRMQAARHFQAGMQTLRQLEFALFDLRLHMTPGPLDGAQIQRILDRVRAEVAVVRPPPFNRFQHGFSHIFAGGYAAGYYSYKWAEVLAADAFSLFEERGVFDRATGERFLHTVLEQGGARDPMDLFVEFRGRRPSIDALVRRLGLAA